MCRRPSAFVLVAACSFFLVVPLHAQDAGDIRETLRITMSDGSVIVLGNGAPPEKRATAVCPDSGFPGTRVLKIEGEANTTSENDVSYSVLWEISNSTLVGTATSNRGDFPSVVEEGTSRFLLETTINNQNPLEYTVDATATEPGPARTYIRTMLSTLTLRDEECLFEILQRMYSLDVDSSPRDVEIQIGGAGEPSAENTFFSRQVPEGAGVSLTAPATAFGEPFTEWQGTINSTDRTIEFVMEGHTGVTAIYGEPPTADVGIFLAGVDGGSLGKRGKGASVDASGIVRLPPGADAVIHFLLSNFGPDIAEVFLAGSFSVAFSTITGMTLGGQPCGVSGGFFSCPPIEIPPGEDVPIDVDLTTGTTTGTDSGGLSVDVAPPVSDPNPENDQVDIVMEVANVGAILVKKYYDLDRDGILDQNEPGINGIEIVVTRNLFEVARDETQVIDINGDGFFDPLAEHGLAFFTGLSTGTHTIAEIIDDPWESTTPGSVQVDVPPNDTVTVVFGNFTPQLDYGDLPDTYRTTKPDGAAHAILAGLSLGDDLDTEDDGHPSAVADGDDEDPSPDDEDGLSEIEFQADGIVRLTIFVNPRSTQLDDQLGVWIDFDNDGSMSGTERVVGTTVRGTAGFRTYTFLPPETAVLNMVRIRLARAYGFPGSPFNLRPVGLWSSGEVEDHFVVVEDYGDAPDTVEPDRPDFPWGYPTRLVDDGARHIGTGVYRFNGLPDDISTIRLGDNHDTDADGAPSVDADGDDRDRSYDEDGIEFRDGFIELSVRAEPAARNGRRVLYGAERGTEVTIVPLASVEGHLDAWMDFNRDGDWEDAGEHIFDSEAVQTGPEYTPLTFSVPASASVGPTFARFRFSLDGNLEFDGPAMNGEVEDYLIHIVDPRVVSSTDDDGPGSLRALLAEANSVEGVDVIDLRGLGKRRAVIELQSPLPTVSDPVVILGGGTVPLDGSSAGAVADGLLISGGSSTVSGVGITGFDGHGIVLDSDGNSVLDGSVADSGGDGIRVTGAGNLVQGTAISGNGGLGIDHGGDGHTLPDDPDTDAVPNAPSVTSVVATDSTRLSGTLSAAPERSFVIELFENDACDPSGFGEGAMPLGTVSVATDASGEAQFSFATDRLVPAGSRVTATATDAVRGTSEFSACAVSTSSERESADVPTSFMIHANYPNPFNPETTLRFDLPETADVSVQVFDLLGRRVLALPPRRIVAGTGRTVRLDASTLSSGVYVYRIRAEDRKSLFEGSGRMTLMK